MERSHRASSATLTGLGFMHLKLPICGYVQLLARLERVEQLAKQSKEERRENPPKDASDGAAQPPHVQGRQLPVHASARSTQSQVCTILPCNQVFTELNPKAESQHLGHQKRLWLCRQQSCDFYSRGRQPQSQE